MPEFTCLRTQLRAFTLTLTVAITVALALLAAPASTQVEVGDNDFKISSAANMAGIHDARSVAVAHNPNDGEYLVVWSETAAILASSGTAIIDRRVIVGRLVDAATGAMGSIVLISTSNNAGREALDPAVVYNSVENEFLVVWWEDDGGVLASNEFEIFGQILSSNLVPVGGNFRISDMGGTGSSSYKAFQPAVAFNSVENEYLVVWSGDDNINGLVDGELEIFGQRVDENGSAQGTNDFRISSMGGTGNSGFDASRPAVAFNSVDNEYIVVWQGDDNVNGLVDDESEVFGQRLDATGIPRGTRDVRFSDMGGTGDNPFDAFGPAVAFSEEENEVLVVWRGDDDVGSLVNGDDEIYGQRVDVSPVPLELLLEVDLSVVNQVTITATDGNAAASVAGPDITGVYLASFFTDAGTTLGISTGSGDLAPNANTPDGSPNLFRAADGADLGLNVWGMASGNPLEFITGSVAFTGTATWTVSGDIYSHLVANGGSGLLYAPADSVDDLPDATLIGLWAVLGAGPEIFSDGFESGSTSAWQ